MKSYDLQSTLAQCEVGEGPIWNPDLGLLFFVDIPAGIIHSYDPASNERREFSRGPVTAAMTLQDNGEFLLFQDGRLSLLDTSGKQCVVATDLCPGNERFNDVIADPEGRVYAGAMGGNGRLFRFDVNGEITPLIDGLGIPNGMGFTPDLKKMYLTDSATRIIYVLDYDRETGELDNRRIFVEIPETLGVPDGMAIDVDGFIWTAIWFGGCLRRYSPEGRLDEEISVPVGQPSSVAFGGSDYSTMFITTASTDAADSLSPPNHDPTRPRGGDLYSIARTGFRGTPAFRSRIRISSLSGSQNTG